MEINHKIIRGLGSVSSQDEDPILFLCTFLATNLILIVGYTYIAIKDLIPKY